MLSWPDVRRENGSDTSYAKKCPNCVNCPRKIQATSALYETNSFRNGKLHRALHWRVSQEGAGFKHLPGVGPTRHRQQLCVVGSIRKGPLSTVPLRLCAFALPEWQLWSQRWKGTGPKPWRGGPSHRLDDGPSHKAPP